MVTETDQDGDSQFLREIRSVVGYDVPIAITLDLHANIFDELADLAQIAVSFRTYPHIDMSEVGVEACSLLDQAMKGKSNLRWPLGAHQCFSVVMMVARQITVRCAACSKVQAVRCNNRES